MEGHAILGAFVHPALELTKDEAERLAAALQRVQKHYPGAKLLSEKHMAIVALATCAGRIYAPRVGIVLGIMPARPPAADPLAEAQPSAIVVDAPLTPDPAVWFNGAPQ